MKTLTMRPGDIPGIGSLFVTAKWDGHRLSITGVSGPKANGDTKPGGSCGQCVGELDEVTIYATGWDADKAARLKAIWQRWHLNDMRAGSQVQEDWLRAHPIPAGTPNHYEQACVALASAGLNPDADGYRYGHAWKTEDAPAEIIAELFAFPLADRPLPGAWGRD